MARECGWTKDYIADTLTVEQIKLYYEKIQKQKMEEAKLSAIITVQAVGTAFGSIKFENFRKFLDKMNLKSEVKKDVISEMKKEGLNIEDK